MDMGPYGRAIYLPEAAGVLPLTGRIGVDNAEAGIFVRVMAMPLVTGKEEGEDLLKVAIEHGSKAFKHKGLNYYELSDLLSDRIIRKRRRRDFVYEELVINSGEFVIENGKPERRHLLMPEKWNTRKLDDWRDKLINKDVRVINCGYSECNDVDWGYIR